MSMFSENSDFFLLQGRFLSSLSTQSPALNVVCRRLVVSPIKVAWKFVCLVALAVQLCSTKIEVVLFSNFSKLHGLVACGGEDGAIECFDMRTRSSVGRIDAAEPAGDIDQVALPCSWSTYV